MPLKPITSETIIYASPTGHHYHLARTCPMLSLSGGDFERLKYRIINYIDIKKRRLNPCICAYDDAHRG